MAIAMALGAGMGTVIVAIAITRISFGGRVIRAVALSLKEMSYVEAARGLGASHLRIMAQHILPQCIAPYLILATARGVAEIQQRLREYGAKHPGSGWILGRGWNYAMFPSSLPDKKILDEVFPDRPAFLEGYDGHTYWANSKALALAQITKDTPNPPNGIIVRDPQTGEATGALKENAQSLVAAVLPKPTRGEKLAALRTGIHWANENGLTRVHSAGGDFEEFDL